MIWDYLERRKKNVHMKNKPHYVKLLCIVQKKKLQGVIMNDREKMNRMPKKLPNGHNIGGGAKQKRRKENKQKSNKQKS